MMRAIVKIDLCGSKQFAAEREHSSPGVRSQALSKLLDVAQECFPDGAKKYPTGTFYKADGDALYFVVEVSTVAIRSSIEFMQSWFHKGLGEYPECRVFLDRGEIEHVDVPGGIELTGKPFENISCFEKGVDEGRVYLTDNLLAATDITIAKFVRYSVVEPRSNEKIQIYYADFLDPRTIDDSSLVHALFVAHPRATEARTRLFELFIVQYLLEQGGLSDLADFHRWAKGKHYPLPPSQQLQEILHDSTYLEKGNDKVFRVGQAAREALTMSQQEYCSAREVCVSGVAESIINSTGRKEAIYGIHLAEIVDEYLSMLFSEVRMMANYFRSTLHLFNLPIDQFNRFDFILRRRLDAKRLQYFSEWRTGFISGLQNASAQNSLYISAVFHNVLATYYLNKAGQVSPYQLAKLQERRIILDTNVLYSLLVPASQFHELVNYFISRLSEMKIPICLFPITLHEYEESLAFVERNWNGDGPNELLITRNPWLHQQYMSDPSRYLGSIAVCRSQFSITKGMSVVPENYDTLNKRLQAHGICLETRTLELTEDEVDRLWYDLRNLMTSNMWSTERYWEFMFRDFPKEVKRHDMTCIASLQQLANQVVPDALGPKILFLTVDSKLYRMRSRFDFICTPEQFLEFILPYLFLNDIPVVDAEHFPNELLTAQLGTLLVKRPPHITEIAKAYFSNPSLAKEDARKTFSGIGDDTARALNDQRFKNIVLSTEQEPTDGRREIADQAAEALMSLIGTARLGEQDRERAKELKREMLLRDQRISKLERTVRYWRSQARKQQKDQ